MPIKDIGKTTVPADTYCRVCEARLAPFYSTQWFVHYCSDSCFEEFMRGIDYEIDSIAIEMKTLNDLFPKGPKDEV